MSEENMRKGGSRSQRNRKRPTSSNDDLVVETQICRLQLDGRPINVANPWIRVVKPYPYTFATFAKARWIGRTVLDVYCTEFGSYPPLYYENAIKQGRILVSDEKVDLNYKIQGRDVLTHTVHRHEPAVAVSSQNGIEILRETDDLVVVNKPATLPVHPCGGYYSNSLSHILEPRFGKLYNINRLDRLTSGLVLLAKSSAVAQQLGKCLMERDSCQKLYLARVKGKFPLNRHVELNKRLESNHKIPCWHGEWINDDDNVASGDGVDVESKKKQTQKTRQEMESMNALGAWITDTSGVVDDTMTVEHLFYAQHSVDMLLDELRRCSTESEPKLPKDTAATGNMSHWLHLACPTRIAKPKDGICEAGSFHDLDSSTYEKTVKPAQTAFAVVHYDERTDSSVLMCRPLTGRTHQIRLHLQFLGHPIANDPNYGGEMFYGDTAGQEAFATAKSKLDALNRTKLVSAAAIGRNNSKVDLLPATLSDTPASQAELNALAHLQRNDDEPLHEFIQRTCVWCARSCGEGDGNTRTMLEFLCRSSGIYLHALAYTMEDGDGENRKRIQYRTKIPLWASKVAEREATGARCRKT